jgi:hypothetical protein
MPWYPRIHAAITATLPHLLPPQTTNLAVVVSALLAKRTCCLSALARAYPRVPPEARLAPLPKHDRLHRRKRLWAPERFLDNPRCMALALQTPLIPHPVRHLGSCRVHWVGHRWDYLCHCPA